MGKPIVHILLHDALVRIQLERLDNLIKTLDPNYVLNKNSGNGQSYDASFSIKNTNLIGAPPISLPHGFSLIVEDMKQNGALEEYEEKQFRNNLGFLPEQFITVFPDTNHHEKHILLAYLVISIAEKLDATYIDLCSVIPVIPEFPGIIFQIYDEYPGREEEIMRSIVDIKYLRAWISHPQFYMPQ